MEPVDRQPLSEREQELLDSMLEEYRPIAQFQRLDPRPGKRAVLVTINLSSDRTRMEIVIRDLGHSDETTFVRRLREGLEMSLRSQLTAFRISFASSKVDSTFAP
jgi:hypothetical protein